MPRRLIVETRWPPRGSRGGSREAYIRPPYLHIESSSPFLSSLFTFSRQPGQLSTVVPRLQRGVDLGRGTGAYCTFPCQALRIVRCTVLLSRGVGKSVPVSILVRRTCTHDIVPLLTSPSSTNSRWTASRWTPCGHASVRFHCGDSRAE